MRKYIKGNFYLFVPDEKHLRFFNEKGWLLIRVSGEDMTSEGNRTWQRVWYDLMASEFYLDDFDEEGFFSEGSFFSNCLSEINPSDLPLYISGQYISPKFEEVFRCEKKMV